MVGEAIDASTRKEAERLDAAAGGVIAQWLEARSDELAAAFASAPSVHVARHLHRLLAEVEAAEPRPAPALRATLCAIPVIVVAGLEARTGDVTLPAVLADAGSLEAPLRAANAFAGARTFAFSPALADASAPETPQTHVHTAPVAVETAVDPVCGMDVAVTPASISAHHDGGLVYFCGTGCRRAYLDDPSRFRP